MFSSLSAKLVMDKSGLKTSGEKALLVTEQAMQFDDELIIIFSKVTTFKIRSKVINPP